MNLHRSILLFLLAFQISSPALEPRLNLPSEVRKKAEEQIISWFGTNQINGMPLLDTNVDWTLFKNWPDEITLEGGVPKPDGYREAPSSCRTGALSFGIPALWLRVRSI